MTITKTKEKTLALIDADYLEALGVQTAGGNLRDIRGYCPVHHLVKGRPDSHPSWYMNTTTGAWLCFSCGQRGSLRYLVSLLGLDASMVEDLAIETARAGVQKWQDEEDEEAGAPAKPSVFVSEYGFNKNPYPPKLMRARRDFRKEQAQTYNVRWSKDDKCFLIPVYAFGALGELLGWQEKSKGYFNNVPEGMEKSKSLFGYGALYNTRKVILVESPLDVLRMANHGITGALATYGSFVSNDQLEALGAASLHVEQVILAFDNDEAGQAANDHCYRALRGVLDVRFAKYPSKKLGKDPGEWPVEEMQAAINEASHFRTKLLK